MSTAEAPRSVPSSNPVLATILRVGGLLMLGIAVIAGVLGGVFAGWPGVASALVGTGMAAVFMGITAASILLANRFADSGPGVFVGAFFGIVMGAWIIKIIVFFVLVFTLRDLSWIQPLVLFLAVVAAVIGSLVVDVLVVWRTRMTAASDVVLPDAVPDDEPPRPIDGPDGV